MPSRSEHSSEFIVVRETVLGLAEGDRRALMRLFGAKHDAQDPPTLQLLGALRAIARLDDDDVIRLSRWFQTYVNKWGQVPIASSRRVDPRADRTKPAR
jgi:hypothetical protein